MEENDEENKMKIKNSGQKEHEEMEEKKNGKGEDETGMTTPKHARL